MEIIRQSVTEWSIFKVECHKKISIFIFIDTNKIACNLISVFKLLAFPIKRYNEYNTAVVRSFEACENLGKTEVLPMSLSLEVEIEHV